MAYEVTIGIPVYNVEKYIRLTMDSALAQTFQSIEFLVLDDCGTDSSMSIIYDYMENHSRGKDIRIIHQPKNQGVSAARNRIIEEACGRMLYFMDSDDLIEPFTIAKLMDAQRKNDADIVFGSYDIIETFNGNRVREAMQYPYSCFTEENQLASFAYRKYGGIQASSCNYLVNLKLLRDINLRFIDIRFWEDMAFTNELVTYCRRAVLLPDITYHYMCHFDSLSHYQQRDFIAKDEILLNYKAVDYLKRRSVLLKKKSYYPKRCSMVMMSAFYVVCNILKNKNKIRPSFSNIELKQMMTHMASFPEILWFRQDRMLNLLFYFMGILPPFLSVELLYCIGKLKKCV